MDNTNNKQYWNNYVNYWKKRVREANDSKDVKDKTNDDTILELYYKKLEVNDSDKFLDYGCGFGRLYHIYKQETSEKGDNYFGIDVSGICLEYALAENSDLEAGKNLKEFDGMHIPFEDNVMDKILCFGVFDACNQEVVIKELFRVLKPEGKILITGKNNMYFPDDEAALIAEINGRHKEHPNYFTDVKKMTEQLIAHHVKLVDTCFFPRRGDFPINRAVQVMPDIFYEWAYLMEKTKEYNDCEYQKFSNIFSETFQNYKRGNF